MLQRVEVCCSVLQCVAVCCSVLQCVAVCCSVPNALCKSALQSFHIVNFVRNWLLKNSLPRDQPNNRTLPRRRSSTLWQFLKCQFATRFTMSNDYSADFWEFLPQDKQSSRNVPKRRFSTFSLPNPMICLVSALLSLQHALQHALHHALHHALQHALKHQILWFVLCQHYCHFTVSALLSFYTASVSNIFVTHHLPKIQHCSVLQCVAVRCGALQCVVVRCGALRCVAVRCSVLHNIFPQSSNAFCF